MKFSKILTVCLLAISLTMFFACKDDDGGDDGSGSGACPDNVSYMSDVVPILNKSCAIENCHVNNFVNGDYSKYADLKGQHDLGKLKPQIENGAMPPSDTAGPKELTSSEKNILLCWIEDGALEN